MSESLEASICGHIFGHLQCAASGPLQDTRELCDQLPKASDTASQLQLAVIAVTSGCIEMLRAASRYSHT